MRLAAARGATCPPADAYVVGALALAHNRAVWAVYDATGGNTEVSFDVYVIGGQPGRRDRVLERYGYTDERSAGNEAPDPIVPMAGDGATLVYADLTHLYRVVSGHRVRIPTRSRAPFAVAGGKVAQAKQTVTGGCICNLSPSWSPDGTKLLFASPRDKTYRVYTVSASGAGEHPITEGFLPQWSPDGSKIAFGRDSGDANHHLVVATVAGSEARVLAPAATWAWSPDGTRLAFSRSTATGNVVGVINADGSGERLLTSGESPEWSPDGTRLVYVKDNGGGYGFGVIGVIDAGGTGEHVVASGGDPEWSPDGTKLAYTNLGFDEIDAVDSDGSGGRRIASGSFATWSPNGGRLGYHRDGSLYAVSAAGTDETRLTSPGEGLNDTLWAWSPAGTKISFIRQSYDESQGFVQPRIWTVGADGIGERRLTSGTKDEWYPLWSPSGNTIAFERGELYSIGADGAGEAPLTRTQPVEALTEGGVYRVGTGAAVAKVKTTGSVRAVGLSASLVALLVQGFFGERIELFNSHTGASLGGVAVDPATAEELSVAGRHVIFHTGRQIELLDASTRAVTRIATASAKPIGLSIEGSRVAWAENLRGRARIRAVRVGR